MSVLTVFDYTHYVWVYTHYVCVMIVLTIHKGPQYKYEYEYPQRV